KKMLVFGELTGIAFQIKDDLFDYGTGEDIGKPTGIDIKEKKMTLPLIFALQKASYFEKRKIIGIIKNNNNNPQKVKEVIAFVIKSGGIQYANKKMHEYRDKALEVLMTFDKNDARDSC